MDDKIKINEKKFTLSDNYESSTDPVRNDVGSYWVDSPSQDLKLSKTHGGPMFTSNDGNRTYEVITSENTLLSSYPYIESEQEITVVDSNEARLDAFIANEVLPQNKKTNRESYFRIKCPIEYTSNVDNKSAIRGDVSFTYNYGSEVYEGISNNVPEREIDNFYNFYQVVSDDGEASKYYNRDSIIKLMTKGIEDPSGTRTVNIDNYIVPKDTVSNSLSLESFKDTFPFSVDISFFNPPGNDNPDAFKDLIEKTSLSTAFCDIMNSLSSVSGGFIDLESMDFQASEMISSYVDSTQTDFKESYAITPKVIKGYDMGRILGMINKRINDPVDFKEDFPTSAGLDFYEPYELARSTESKYSLSKQWSGTTKTQWNTKQVELENSLTTIVRENFKSFTDTLSGATPYCSNIILYRISKFESGASAPIQNFWIPAQSSIFGMNYIDTQIKYGKKYDYKIYAYKLVVGSKYSFDKTSLVSNISFGFTSLISEYARLVNPETNILEGLSRNIQAEYNEVSDTTYRDLGDRISVMSNYFLTKEFDNKRLKEGLDQYIYDLESDKSNDTNFEVVNFAKDILSGKTRTFGTTDVEYSKSSFSTSEVSKLNQISSNWNDFSSSYELFEESLKLSRQYRNVISVLSTLFPWDGNPVDVIVTEDYAKALNNLGISTNENIIYKETSEFAKIFTTAGKGNATRKKMTESLKSNKLLDFFLRQARDLSATESLVVGDNYKISKDEIFQFARKFVDNTEAFLSDIAIMQSQYVDLISSIISFKSSVDVDIGISILQYKTTPDVRLMEIPYFEDSGAVLDNPPNIPNVSFNTYRNVQNRMGISLNAGQGLTPMAPITFSEEEERYYQLYRESRKLNDFQDIDFKSDEFENLPKTFEIRRLAVAPKSYDDFKDARIINTSTSYAGGKSASSTNYEDNIEPNRKYYYMFRATDRRGIRSNPTAIYEVEIVENSGAVYPLINSYEMGEQDKQSTKSLKRLFNIVPRLKQVLPAPGSDKLGTEDEGLFGKTFKIRLTSKKTGKVVDFNVSFREELV